MHHENKNQTNGHFNVKVNGTGTYWGKPPLETLTATSAGTGYLNTRVKVYNSSGKFIRNYDINTTVKITSGAKSTQPVKATTSPKAAKPTTVSILTRDTEEIC